MCGSGVSDGARDLSEHKPAAQAEVKGQVLPSLALSSDRQLALPYTRQLRQKMSSHFSN